MIRRKRPPEPAEPHALDVELVPVTLASFEAVVLALGRIEEVDNRRGGTDPEWTGPDPDKVLFGAGDDLPEGVAPSAVLVARTTAPPDVLEPLLPVLTRAFLAAAQAHAADAARLAFLPACKAGVDGMTPSGPTVSLARALSRLPFSDWQRLRSAPLREALLWLHLRGIDAMANALTAPSSGA